MTSPNTTTGWNATAGSNSTDHFQNFNHNQGKGDIGENMTGDYSTRSIPIGRSEYYKTHYDFMTGVRIAGTLGGFFIFVLLTLLYKSKCKKSSREPTPIPAYQGQPTHPDLVVLTSNPTPQPLEETDVLLHNNYHYLMDQQPGPSSRNHYQSPKVLLTVADDSSESSMESDLFLPGFNRRESNTSLSNKFYKCPPIGTTYSKKKSSQPGTQQMSLLQKNIDIHVTQATPTISPSGSENIFRKQSRKKSKGSGSRDSRKPSTDSNSNPVSGGTNPLFFLQAENLSLKYMDDTSSENIPTRYDFDEDDSGGSLGSDSVFSFERKPSIQLPDEQDQDEGDGEICRVTLTQAHAQVHHRDSYCSSEYESITDYLECHRRRSSSTQTTWSDLRQCLALGQTSANLSPQLPSHTTTTTATSNVATTTTGNDEATLSIPNATPPTNSSMLLTPSFLLTHASSSSTNSSPLINCTSARKQSIIRKYEQEPSCSQNVTTSTMTTLSKDNLNSTQMSSSTSSPTISTTITSITTSPSTAISTTTATTTTTTQNQYFNVGNSKNSNSPNSGTNISSSTATPSTAPTTTSTASNTTTNVQQGKNKIQTLTKAYSLQCDDEQHLFQE